MAAPSPSTVYNNAQAGRGSASTPGLNAVIAAWGAFQDFTGGGAVLVYNRVIAIANAAGSLIA